MYFVKEKIDMNNWNIPLAFEKEIIKRDTVCVYCGVTFGSQKETRKNQATWEHIINDAKIYNFGKYRTLLCKLQFN